MAGEKLSYACCRLFDEAVDEHAGPDNLQSDKEFPILSPIFLASKASGISLCRVEPLLHSLPKRENTQYSLKYDRSIQVIPWEMMKDGSKTTNMARCFEKVRAATPRRFRIKPSTISSLESTKENPLKRTLSRHLHRANIHELLDKNSHDTDFCGVPSDYHAPVTPLASLSIRQEAGVGNGDGKQCSLALANIKRQIVGVHLAFCEGEISTSIIILDSKGKEAKYFVEAVSARQRDPGAPALLYVVMPSTRISILQAEQECVSSPKEQEILAKRPSSDISSILIQTVRCLRGSLKAPVARSFLLSGPPGVGKTFAVKHGYEVCSADGPTLLVSLGALMSSGEGPGEVSRALVEEFERTAMACEGESDNQTVAILFIDEFDPSEMVARVFSSLLDRVMQGTGGWQRMIVVAATNHSESVPSYLRRPGRLDKEINAKPPTPLERATIINSLIADIPGIASALGHDDLMEIADMCVGYVAADMVALIRQVYTLALEEPNFRRGSDIFHRAMVDVRASSLRSASSSTSSATSWSDIGRDPGGAQDTLRRAIEWPRTKREAFRALGLQSPSGILLYGPPGCGKTSLGRAAASAAGTSFIAFSPSDVYSSSYLGEAEAVIRKAFKFARAATPCILFFDELDSILGSDQGGSEHGANRSGSAESRVLSTFLNEMDGVDGSSQDGVMVLGSTNRPWTLDAALMRSGRFDKAIYVPPPDYEGRLAILKIRCRAWGISDEELECIASDQVSAAMTGAEIVGACNAASLLALKRSIDAGTKPDSIAVTLGILMEVFTSWEPALSDPDALVGFKFFEESRLSKIGA